MSYEVGQKVIWSHIPRGGYGYAFKVNGTVVAVSANRVTIEVQKASGETVRRVVKPMSLEPRP